MSEKTLKFDIVVVNAKKFHTSKKPIVLSLADIDKIEVSDEFKHNTKVLNILLAIWVIISLHLYVLFYLR